MAALLANALGGYQIWFGKDVLQLQEVPPATLPLHIPLEHIPLYHEARREHMEHNATIDNGRMGTVDVMGQMLAQIVNKIKPDKVLPPQIKIDMLEYYKGDPAEINNWLRSMETYFTLVQVTDLSQTIIITTANPEGKRKLSRHLVSSKIEGMGGNGKGV